MPRHQPNKRILLIGDFGRTNFGAHYYNTNFALHAGFIRAGHHVLTFSDRDVAREASVFKRKALGRGRMSQALIETARTYQPHLVLFGHADMTAPETFAAVRKAAPYARLAQFNVDALFRTGTMALFAARAQHVDFSFITSAAPEKLRRLGAPPGSVAYFPNPVDPAIAIRNVSTIARGNLAFDGIFLGTGIERREIQVSELKVGLPASFRLLAAGGVSNTPRLSGPSFLETLASGTMSPNLPLDDTRPVDFLYASDRLAQLLAHGILAFCQKGAQLETVYEDGIVPYSSIADLAAKMAEFAEDDARRRQIAAKGHQIGCGRTSAERVARYMLDLAFGDGPTEDYGWPSEPI